MEGKSRRCRIMVVDDHPLLRAGVAATLGRHGGFEVVAQAGRADDALEEINRHGPDLVLLDLLLGGERGLKDSFALIADCRKQRPEVKVLVLTSIEDPGYVVRARRAGARGYMGKGESEENLVHAIRTVLAGNEYVSPRIAVDLTRRFSPGAGTELGRAVEKLTNRELHVLHAVGLHLPNRIIAADLGLNVKTVESHKESMKEKLGVSDAAQLAELARRYVVALRA